MRHFLGITPAQLRLIAPVSLLAAMLLLLGGSACVSAAEETTQPTTQTTAQPTTESTSQPTAQPSGADAVAATADVSKPTNRLQGSAELSTVRGDNNVRAYKASQFYKQGVGALNRRNYAQAADLFKKAGDAFESTVGYEKFIAEARFAEAQARRLLGQKKEASKLYQAAADLFQEYDPLSPYLKATLDNLKKTAPMLSGNVNTLEARLQAMQKPTRIMTVDRNVMLKGGIADSGSAQLYAEKATQDVPKDYVNKTIHKAFVRMTCLETAELGSNYITAENRWNPLIANGKTVTIAASSDFLAPVIKVKINARYYNVAVDLPDLTASRQTVFLLTDGNNIVAIEPTSEDMWSLVPKFNKNNPTDVTFSWKKLSHHKRKTSPTLMHR